MKTWSHFLLLMAVALIFQGCASKHMRPVSPDAVLSYAPSAEESVVIFMRPSVFGGAIQSSVFDVTTADNVLVGIVSSKTKVAYRVTAGDHLFMVVGESADFMKAELLAGKTYYALVTPRMGVWKARFSLRPVHGEELSSDEFKDWESSCEFVENTESSLQWAKDNAPSIQDKREHYFEKWMSKPEEERPVLRKEDGL